MAKPREICIEYSAIFGKDLTSGGTRKFLSRTHSQIRAFERTNSHGRTASESFFILKRRKNFFSQKIHVKPRGVCIEYSAISGGN